MNLYSFNIRFVKDIRFYGLDILIIVVTLENYLIRKHHELTYSSYCYFCDKFVYLIDSKRCLLAEKETN